MSYTADQITALRAVERATEDAFDAGLPLSAIVEEVQSAYTSASEQAND
jgi:hypothetical protein